MKANKTTVDGKQILTVAEAEAQQVLKQQANQLQNTHATRLQELGRAAVVAVGKAGMAFYDICVYIRSNEVAPKLATHELLQVGLHKARVSELVTVAHASEENWLKFQARTIGFRNCLALERGSVIEVLAEVQGIGATELKAEVAEEAAESMGANQSQAGVAADAIAAAKKRYESAASYILTYGEKNRIASKSWTLGNGWTLKLTRDKDFKVKLAQKAAAKAKAEHDKKSAVQPVAEESAVTAGISETAETAE